MRTTALLILALCSTARGQVGSLQRFVETDVKARIQVWNAESGMRVTAVSVPLRVTVPVASGLSLEAMTAGSSASLSDPAQTMSGLTDSRLRATCVLFDETLLLTAGITLATGKTTLEDDQVLLGNILSQSALDFETPTFGQGSDVNLGFVYAMDLGGWVMGVGAGVVGKSSFRPSQSADVEYRPGGELTATVGVDRVFDAGTGEGVVTGDISVTLYQADKVNDEAVFRSGLKAIATLRGSYPVANSAQLDLLSEFRTKGKNQRGLGSLEPEELNSNGHQFDARLALRFRANESFEWAILAGGKYYMKNEYGSNGAKVGSVGAGIDWSATRSIAVRGSLEVLSGTLEYTRGTSAVTGWDGSVSVAYRF